MRQAVIAREVGSPDLPHDQRTFEGVLTSDPNEIARLAFMIGATIRESTP